MAETKQRFEWVDALRGWAILGVILVHTAMVGTEGLPSILVSILANGDKGVQLFFLMSAFTLYYTYQKHSKQENLYIGNFFIRRFFRIAPLYYLAIAYYLLNDGLQPKSWMGGHEYITVWTIISNIVFMHGVNPHWYNCLVPGGWSITVEMSFYLFVPLLVPFINSKSKVIFFSIISLIISQLVRFVLLKFPLIDDIPLWHQYTGLFLPTQISIFALGILLYYMVFPQHEKKSKYDGKILSYSLLMGGGLLILYAIYGKILPEQYLFGLSFMAIAYVCSQTKISLIDNKFTVLVGKYSYTLYITHFIILYWLYKLNYLNFLSWDSPLFAIANFSIRFIITFILSMALAFILYYLIEQPMINLGKRIIKKREANSASLIAKEENLISEETK